VIKSVIIYLANELPILVDLLELPSPTAQTLSCTNVRTVDGKRPSFVSNPKSTFVFPWHLIRLIEVPIAPTDAEMADTRVATTTQPEPPPPQGEPFDEEPDADLLARIREV
jgi:hypothetical protein